MFVRYLIASGPGCFRCLMFMPSGPVKLLLVLFEMANCTCMIISRISSVGRFMIVCSMCLLILFVLYGVTFVNYLLNAFAFLMSVMAVLVLKRMLLFCCVGCFLLDSFAMVSHRECRLCLRTILSRYCFQVFVLCSCICLFM